MDSDDLSYYQFFHDDSDDIDTDDECEELDWGYYENGTPRSKSVVYEYGLDRSAYTWRPTLDWARNTVNYLNREYSDAECFWEMEENDGGYLIFITYIGTTGASWNGYKYE